MQNDQMPPRPYMEIRRAAPDDWSHLIAVDARLAQPAEWHHKLHESIAAGACSLAFAGGTPLGYALLDYSFFGNGFVPTLFVAPQGRRVGVGTALMQHMAQACRTPTLWTSTNLSNVPMQRLLAKLAYTLSGVIHNLDPGDPELVYCTFLADTRGHDRGNA